MSALLFPLEYSELAVPVDRDYAEIIGGILLCRNPIYSVYSLLFAQQRGDVWNSSILSMWSWQIFPSLPEKTNKSPLQTKLGVVCFGREGLANVFLLRWPVLFTRLVWRCVEMIMGPAYSFPLSYMFCAPLTFLSCFLSSIFLLHPTDTGAESQVLLCTKVL